MINKKNIYHKTNTKSNTFYVYGIILEFNGTMHYHKDVEQYIYDSILFYKI